MTLRRKTYLFTLIGAVVVLASFVTGCARSPNVPYAPDFALKSLKGDIVHLSDFRGKGVMLTFWKIDCPACEFQIPFMQSLYNELSGQNIALLTINAGDNPVRVQDFASTHELSYPILLDQGVQVSHEYGLIGVPMTFFIDPEGVVKSFRVGAFESREAMESAMKDAFPSFALTLGPEVGPEIGKLAPDFTLQTSDSQVIALSDLRGKTVLLNFWVSSCPACVDEMSYFQKVLDKEAVDNVAVLAINCGESSQTSLNAANRLGITFPLLLDPDRKVCTSYKRGCPTTFLIDEAGVIKAIRDDVFQSPEEIETMLRSL